jgi:hypothetical protein
MHTDTERTYSIHLYTHLGTDYQIEVEREKRRTYDNGDNHRLSTTLIRRQLSVLNEQTVPSGPRTITTYADLAALISECAADLAAQEAASPAIPAVSDP